MNLLIFGLLLTVYFTLHSVLANKKVKAYLIERIIDKRYYRLVFNFLSVVLILPIYFYYKSINASSLFENNYIQYFGLMMSGIGVVLLFLALMQYNLSEFAGMQQLKNNENPQAQNLKISGINKFVRHPLYFATLILLWGLFLYKTTDVFLTLTLVTTVYLYIGTKLEEQKLLEEFGSDYSDYQNRVGMLLPRVGVFLW